ncbi:TonB-dependent siderophore receptor [Acetobacteraceae bacterium EV16G]|uniref:TonB-dependent siderophore receptor n=1 Tax=Sorlinia euscelidii TaxID=3081148 RepID=A0ABU7TZ36_9PROT
MVDYQALRRTHGKASRSGKAQHGPKLSKLLVLALSAGAGALEVGESEARSDSEDRNTSQSATSLPDLDVQSHKSSFVADMSNTNDTLLHVDRMPASVFDTPQQINVVPHELIQQQQIYTLDQALSNVPGITMSSGEGNGGPVGDQFRIRGQQARGDIYQDGLKDFGVYVRDVFNTDNVEVIKGASGQYFGAGNVGGIINNELKHANLKSGGNATQAFGSGMQYRGTVDANYRLGEHEALRVNGMYNKQNVADRNNIRTDRYGVAADLGLGLGTKTTYHLNYQWLGNRGMSDQGVGMLQVGKLYHPATEYGLDRKTSYARDFNRDDSNIHMVTSQLSSKISDWLTLSNNTRFSHYDRDFSATAPGACTVKTNCAPTFLAGGNPVMSYGAGGGMGYLQNGYGLQNVTMGKAKFKTAFLTHHLNAGVDIQYTKDDRKYATFINRVNNQGMRAPQFNYPQTYLTYPSSGDRTADFRDLGLFIADKIDLSKKLSLFGALRWDDYQSSYWSSAAAASGVQRGHNNSFSPSASLIYNINHRVNLYFTFSRSYKPVGTDVSAQTTLRNVSDTPTNGVDLKPQRSDLFEVGSKMNFFNRRLGMTVALFQINQNNSFTFDEYGGILTGFSDAGTGRLIRGAELSMTGKLTDKWDVYGSYAYMTGTIQNSDAYRKNTAPQLPHNTFSIWSTYDISSLILPKKWGRLSAGGGAQYASAYWADNANTARMPYNFFLNGIITYDIGRYHVQFNANNLTNRVNYGSAFNASRAVPLPGRTFIGSVGVAF